MRSHVRIVRLLWVVLLAPPVSAEGARESRLCAFLGDRVAGRRDADAFVFDAAAGEQVEVLVEGRDDPRNRGTHLSFRLMPRGGRRSGSLPLRHERTLEQGGEYAIRLSQLGAQGTARDAGEYCVTLRSSETAADTLRATESVEVQWVAIEADQLARPPFVRKDSGLGGGLLQSEFPLRGGAVYGVVVTRRVRDTAGRALEASDDFRAAKGTRERRRSGPQARWSTDPQHPDNPFPDPRLVGADGTVTLPDRWILSGLDPGDPMLDAARTELRGLADTLSGLRGFGTTSPVEIALSAPVDLGTVTPDAVLFFERTDGGLDIEGLLQAARRHGVRPQDVAVAISFPTQRIEDDLRQARARLEVLAAADHFAVTTLDTDLGDDLELGVFGEAGNTDGPFADYLDATPHVATVVAGLLPAPDFRGDGGAFDPARLSGAVPFDDVRLDLLLTLPATGTPPFPVVIVGHGYGGDNRFVLDLGGILAEHGIAAIGISALAHGRRGSPLDLLVAKPAFAREVFRQSSVDLMSLLRAIEQGIDVDGTPGPDLRGSSISYLGISLGGILGGLFAGVEDRLGPVVLNVAGGRSARLAESEGLRPLVAGARATGVGLAIDSPGFATYYERFLDIAAIGQDPSDVLNWARRYRAQPLPGAPRRNVLLQQGEGDVLIPNPFTEELAHVADLPANMPLQNADGVSGYWIFEPPGGHAIFAREDVRQQAIAFLLSGGTDVRQP